MDLRQLPEWGSYLSQLGWKVEKVGQTKILVRKIPLLGYSLIKIQRPQNPLPFSKIDQLAKKNRALFVLIEPEIERYQEKDFLSHGYQKSTLSLTHTATTSIDLHPSEKDIFSSFSENARRNIKKAQQNNLLVKKFFLKNTSLDGEFNRFFSLISNLGKLKKIYLPKADEFYKKMMALKKISLLLFAQQDAEPQAVVWLAYFDKKMSYLHTGVTQKGYNLLANYLLVWEGIKAAKGLGLATFDFEGIYDPRFPKARKSWINFSDFKKRFHGQIILYPQPWIKCYNIVFKFFYLCSQIFWR